jgi:hypothetical protein
MTLISYQEARHLLVVDPNTGLQIEHVKAIDPERGWVEIWSTYEAHPEHPSLWMENGVAVERPVMLMNLRDPETGQVTYMSRVKYRDFDVIHKDTGEVFYECRVPKRQEAE